MQVDEKEQLKNLTGVFGVGCAFADVVNSEELKDFASIFGFNDKQLSENLDLMENSLKQGIIYHVSDYYECHEIQFVLPKHLWEHDVPLFCIIGPFILLPPEELASRVHPANKDTREALIRLYRSIPIVLDYGSLKQIICLEAKYIMPSNEIVEQDVHLSEGLSRQHFNIIQTGVLDSLSTAQVEERYRLEDLTLDAVKGGDESRALELVAGFAGYSFRRGDDFLRSFKNAMIIWNTLCRRAVHEAMVPALYIDRASSLFASEIESALSMHDLVMIFTSMIHEYCTLSLEQSLTKYSSLVRDTLLYIHRNLNKPLSVSMIADQMHVTSNYLSSRFSSEMDMTITSYINQRRVQESLQYLLIPDLPVQVVAHKVGFGDANYYARVFHRFKGISPVAYRKMIGHHSA